MYVSDINIVSKKDTSTDRFLWKQATWCTFQQIYGEIRNIHQLTQIASKITTKVVSWCIMPAHSFERWTFCYWCNMILPHWGILNPSSKTSTSPFISPSVNTTTLFRLPPVKKFRNLLVQTHVQDKNGQGSKEQQHVLNSSSNPT